MFRYLIHGSECHFLPSVKKIPCGGGELILSPRQSPEVSRTAIFASQIPKCRSKEYSVWVEAWGPGKVAWWRAVCSLAAPATLPSDYIGTEEAKKAKEINELCPFKTRGAQEK